MERWVYGGYYRSHSLLSFKMLGVSIHALQIANVLPTHSLQQVPYIEFIGLYPTLETIITQLMLLLVVLATTFYIRKKASYIPITPA
jgi:high-affinity iron transporter